VRRGFRSDAEVRQILAAQPEVRDYLSYLALPARAADKPVSLGAVAIATPADRIHFAIPEGRMFAASGEAIVSQLVLSQLHLEVGDELRLLVQNRPLTLRIVGRFAGALDISPTVLYSMETFHQQVDPAAQPLDYALALAPGTDLVALRAALLRASDDQLGVFLPSRSVRGLGWVHTMLLALISSLLVIGLINILNTALLGVQERMRELAILKAVGLTPGQVSAGVVIGMSVLALLAVLISIPLGIGIVYALWSYAYAQLGGGTGIVLAINWLWMALLLPGAILAALLGSALPAWQAGRVPVVEALRYE
jgi:putative ABC transport system permease protein